MSGVNPDVWWSTPEVIVPRSRRNHGGNGSAALGWLGVSHARYGSTTSLSLNVSSSEASSPPAPRAICSCKLRCFVVLNIPSGFCTRAHASVRVLFYVVEFDLGELQRELVCRIDSCSAVSCNLVAGDGHVAESDR